MKCQNCGKELPESYFFCPHCGAQVIQEQPPVTIRKEEKTFDSLTQYILLSGIGFGILIVIGIVILLLVEFDPDYIVSFGYIMIHTVLAMVLGIILMCSVRAGDEEKKKKFENIQTVIAISVQIVIILFALFGGKILYKTFKAVTVHEHIILDIFTGFTFTAPIVSVIAILIGLLRKKTVRLTVISYAAAFVLCIITLSHHFVEGFDHHEFYNGGALGIFQSVVLLMPNIGHWKKEIQTVSAPDPNNGIVSVQHKQKMFCPHCGARIQTGNKFCDRCGKPIDQ